MSAEWKKLTFNKLKTICCHRDDCGFGRVVCDHEKNTDFFNYCILPACPVWKDLRPAPSKKRDSEY